MKSWQVRIYLDPQESGKGREHKLWHIASDSPVSAAKCAFAWLESDERERLYEIEVTKDHDLAQVIG